MKKIIILCAALALAVTTAKAQETFVPVTTEYCPEYNSFIKQTLIGESYEYFLCTPAFENEYALSLHGDTLVYIRAEEEKGNIWYSVNFTKRKAKAKTSRFELVLSQDEAKQVSNLMEVATMTANFFNDRIGFDGVTYYLHSYTRHVKVWYPKDGTRTHRTVTMMDSLCYAVEHADHAVLQRQLEVCSTLTDEFRALYPISYFTPSREYWLYSRGIERVSIFSKKLCVAQRCKDCSEAARENTFFAEIRDSVTRWSRELFLHYNEKFVYILLSDTSVARCEVMSDRDIVITIPRDRLCLDLILSTTGLVKGYYQLTSDGTWQAVRREDFPWWPGIFDIL